MTLHTELFEAETAAEAAPLPALKSRIEDIVAARDAALAKAREAAATLERAYDLSEQAAGFARQAQCGRRYWGVDRTANKHYTALFREGFDVAKSLETFRCQLDASVWTYLYEETGIRDMMDATAARDFDRSLREDVPEVTLDNLRATFETLVGSADMIFARGLAVAFARLDGRFKSHDAFKLGSRMIIDRAFSEYSGSFNRHWAEETIIDVERVFAKLDDEAPAGRGLIQEIDACRPGYGPQQSITESTYFRIRGFKNGNAHLWFTRDDLVEKANGILAQYYGEVIPDAAEAHEDDASFRTRTNLPSRDLQFYHTPEAAAEAVVGALYVREGMRVLEPSGGEGHLVRPLLAKGCHVTTVEIHGDRVAKLRALEGADCTVIQANFLNEPADPRFDAVVMNPPFYGTHWMDHVRHAFEFLAPGGQLLAILPVSAQVAETKAHLRFRRWAEQATGGGRMGMFTALPAESFAEAGTNINTVILRLRKGR